MMQVSLNEIIHMVPVPDLLMTAGRPVNMIGGVSSALMLRRAAILIRRAYRKRVFVHVVIMQMM